MKNRVFHSAKIGGHVFDAYIMEEGPVIVGKNGHGADLGVSYLRYFVPMGVTRRAEGWWVAKYGNDASLELEGFTRTQAIELSSEFGIPFWTPYTRETDPLGAFCHGSAWEGLKSWVADHPALARKLSVEGTPYYLPFWLEMSQGSRPLFEARPHQMRDNYLAKHGLLRH